VDRCTFAAKAPYGLTATSSTAGPRLGRYSDVGGGRACCRVPASSETQTLPTLRPVRRSRRSFATVGSIPWLPGSVVLRYPRPVVSSVHRADPCIHRDLGPDSWLSRTVLGVTPHLPDPV